jgi:hypothetical protein
MQALDESARKEYLYGQGNVVSREEDYAGEETD